MLNSKQQEVFDLVINKKQPITYLTGAGGTGKSHLISEIAKHCDHILTGTTHQSKTVLSHLSGKPSQTVHSYFGFVLVNKDYKQTLVRRTDFEPEYTEVLIIDEISMLPNVILKAAIEGLGTFYSQLLFVGDPVQLPAVSNKPNLKLIEPYKIELTQQMRQAECATLQNYMQSLRNSIESGDMPHSLFTDAPAVNLIDSHTEFCREYLKCTGSKKIIAYRNNIIDKYNENLVSGDSTFNPGDIVIIDKPIGNIARNQDQVCVTSVEELEDYFIVSIVTDQGAHARIKHYKRPSQVNVELQKLKEQRRESDYWELLNHHLDLNMYMLLLYTKHKVSL